MSDLGKLGAVLRALLAERGKPVCIADLTTGEIGQVDLELATSPAGLLPVFLAAGDTVWREATGRRLGIEQAPDPEALLGLRATGVAPGPVAPVLLSVMEAVAQAERPDMLLVNDLKRDWVTATERMRRLRQRPATAEAPASPAAPSS